MTHSEVLSKGDYLYRATLRTKGDKYQNSSISIDTFRLNGQGDGNLYLTWAEHYPDGPRLGIPERVVDKSTYFTTIDAALHYMEGLLQAKRVNMISELEGLDNLLDSINQMKGKANGPYSGKGL